MISGLALTLLPPMGTMDMDSVPPPIPTWIIPAMMAWATCAMDWVPEAQKRFTVTPATLCGSPASSAALRATFIPCSASGMAQPMTTSSICSGSRP